MKISIELYFISLLFLMIVSCETRSPETPEQERDATEELTNSVSLTGSQFKAAGIELGKVEMRQISGTIKVSGVLDVPPQQLISISAPMGGFLKNTVLLQGSRVKKGQFIATIDNLEFIQIQQDYLEAKHQLEFAKADYERQQQLAGENVNSQKTLQQSKTNYAIWQAKYIGLLEKLKVLNFSMAAIEAGNITSSMNLYSPINGYVTEVNVNTGRYVNPTDVLFEIVDTEHLHAELTVFEKDIPKLKIGQRVRFTLANEIKERTATVYLIGRKITSDRTIRIHCHIDEEDTELLPGMYLKANVETQGNLVPALPDDAVIDYLGKKYIFIAANERKTKTEEQHDFAMTEVSIGAIEFGYTEVEVPKEIDYKNVEVVIKGAYSLISKMKNAEEVD